MSEIRRKLLIDSIDSGGFERVIEEINKLPGEKSILTKFDDSQLVWILTYANSSSTNQDLYVFDLKGNIVGQYTSINTKSGRHYGGVINNYAVTYSNADRNVTFNVFQLTENGLINVRNSPSLKNWANFNYFGYKDNNDNYHMCSNSNSTRECVFDYNITQNTVNRLESSVRYYAQWYDYDGQYFRGMVFDNTYRNFRAGYIKRTSTVNSYSSSDLQNATPHMSSYGGRAKFIPVFDHKPGCENISYEMYYCAYNTTSWYNILGLDTSDPTSISTGNIVLTIGTYNPLDRGMLSYIKNGEFHAYSYNQTTGIVDLMI